MTVVKLQLTFSVNFRIVYRPSFFISAFKLLLSNSTGRSGCGYPLGPDTVFKFRKPSLSSPFSYSAVTLYKTAVLACFSRALASIK